MAGSRNKSAGGRVNLSPERAAEYDRVLMAFNLGIVTMNGLMGRWLIGGEDVSEIIWSLALKGEIANNPPRVTYKDIPGVPDHLTSTMKRARSHGEN